MTTTRPSLEACFIDGPRGRLFELRLQAEGSARSDRPAVLMLPPFGEEMNRSRRFLVALGRRLAAGGMPVCLPDLYGTGDSEGAFADTEWVTWLADVAFFRERLWRETNRSVLLLAVRTGALLAVQSLRADPVNAAGLICVDAVHSGDRFMTQLLRLRVASGMSRGQTETTKALRDRLAAGETLEVAGYTINPGLFEGMTAASLADPGIGASMPVLWYEVVAPSTESVPSPKPPRAWAHAPRLVRQVRDAPVWAIQEPPHPTALIETIATDVLDNAA